MDVDYSFPGSIEIKLGRTDLESMHHQGFTVDRDGFSGMDSKTWVHLPQISAEPSFPNECRAVIEPGGDLHIHLSRGFGGILPLVIDRADIAADEELIHHYLGDDGTISIDVPK